MASISRTRETALGAGNFEVLSWYYFRISGILLLFLVLGHMAIMHLVNNVDIINWAFVRDRWASPLWRLYDWFLLILAMTHGANGMRIIITDYIHNNGIRLLVMTLLWVLTVFLTVIGTQVIVTFPLVAPLAP